jgi:hypothetical protein
VLLVARRPRGRGRTARGAARASSPRLRKHDRRPLLEQRRAAAGAAGGGGGADDAQRLLSNEGLLKEGPREQQGVCGWGMRRNACETVLGVCMHTCAV